MAFRQRAVLTAAAVTLSMVAPTYAAEAATIGGAGDMASLRSGVGTRLPAHRYGHLSEPALARAAFVNIEPAVTWRSIANGRHDRDVKRWAEALEGTGRKLVSFSHEPMTEEHRRMGTARTFIRAFRHVVRIFDAQGATNVRWVWNATSHSFRISRTSAGYGAKWYPGNRFVDFVAGESFNRYGCGHGTPFSFRNRIKQILAFARNHGKRMVVAEFGANAYPGRAEWIRAATRFMNRNREDFRGAFYFNLNPDPCRFKLTTRAEFRALRNMVNTLS